MMDTNGQGFFIHFDNDADVCHLGAAVILPEGYLAVAGFVGVMPAKIGRSIIYMADAAKVKVTRVRDDGNESVVAITWGDLDAAKLWDLISFGIAESATKAILNEITAVQSMPDNLDDLLGPDRK